MKKFFAFYKHGNGVTEQVGAYFGYAKKDDALHALHNYHTARPDTDWNAGGVKRARSFAAAMKRKPQDGDCGL